MLHGSLSFPSLRNESSDSQQGKQERGRVITTWFYILIHGEILGDDSK
jgi:hypothetical protein